MVWITWNSYMTAFVGYINNTVIKPLILCNSHSRIVEQIINIIPKWFHVFTQGRGAYKHKSTRIFSLHIILYLSTLTFAIIFIAFYPSLIFTKIMLAMLTLNTNMDSMNVVVLLWNNLGKFLMIWFDLIFGV